MTFLKQNWFKIFLVLILCFFAYSINKFLMDRNEIYAQIGHKQCLAEWSDKLLNPAICGDIRNYNLKSYKLLDY